ncbi:hypothetical protein Pmani_001478 [Petrolisthes manimaculis]|uniref:Uncharacterized protein n=1 Tax=Petrolisthes manimaculis TaxID=1843537 RepID=A0AAE1QKH8_9EUCA|nr:hypothetical protein Pmani_001478 [Petrolisthes manimaculis]
MEWAGRKEGGEGRGWEEKGEVTDLTPHNKPVAKSCLNIRHLVTPSPPHQQSSTTNLIVYEAKDQFCVVPKALKMC